MSSPTVIFLAGALLVLPLPLLVRELNGVAIIVSLPFFFNALPLSLASLSLAFASKSCSLRGSVPALLASGWCLGIVAIVSPGAMWFYSHPLQARMIACQAALAVVGACSLLGLGGVFLAWRRREGRGVLPAGAIIAGLVLLSYLLVIAGLNAYSELSETRSAGLLAIYAGAQQFAFLASLAAVLIAGGALLLRTGSCA